MAGSRSVLLVLGSCLLAMAFALSALRLLHLIDLPLIGPSTLAVLGGLALAAGWSRPRP